MQFLTVFGFIAAVIGCGACAWQRQWIFSLYFAFSAAYTLFDKVVPNVLPRLLVDGFSVMSFVLALLFIYQQFMRKKKAALEQ